MEHSGFHPSVNGDRKYKAIDWAEYFASFITNGVFPILRLGHPAEQIPSAGLQVTADEGMKVILNPGRGWINGRIYRNTGYKEMIIDTADGVLRRIDRIVMRWDLLGRDLYTYVKKGAPASTPQPQGLQRDADAFELCLADVFVNNGVVNITQANITDQRFNMSVCGITTGVIQQIDFDIITAQFNAFFAEYKPRIEEDYREYAEKTEEAFAAFLEYLTAFKHTAQSDVEEWIETIKDILDENVAASLLLKIQDLEKDVPVSILGTVEHGVDHYPVCNLYITDNGAGMSGAGMTGAGGETLTSIPAEYELDGHETVQVKTIAKYAEYTTSHKISENMFSFTSPDNTTSLLLTLN